MKYSKRNLLDNSIRNWNCNNCRDTNSFMRVDRRKTWLLSFSLDEIIDYGSINTDIVSKYTDNIASTNQMILFDVKGDNRNNSNQLSIVNDSYKLEISNNNCQYVSNNQSLLNPSVNIKYYNLTFFKWSIIWFILGIITTIIYIKINKNIRIYINKYIDDYINNLETRILNAFKIKDYYYIKTTLEREILYVELFRGNDHLDTAAFSHLLAKAYLSLKLFDRSLYILSRIYITYKNNGADIYLANVIEDFATLEYHQNKLEQSLDHYIEALDIHVNLLSSGKIFRDKYVQSTVNKSFHKQLPSNSSKNTEEYRRKLIQQTISIVKSKCKEVDSPIAINMFNKTKRLSTNVSQSDSNLSISKTFLSPYKCKNNDDNSYDQTPSRSLIDAFDLEVDEERELREFELMLKSPDVTVTPNSKTTSFISHNQSDSMIETIATSDVARLHHMIGRVLSKQLKYISSLQYYNLSLEMYNELHSTSEFNDYADTILIIYNEIDIIKNSLFSINQSNNAINIKRK